MEITARELRIGNLLDYYGQTVIVLEIKRNENIECGYFNDSIGFERKLTENHSPKPIPLTEEWLLKFGFYEIYFNDAGKRYSIIKDNIIFYDLSITYWTSTKEKGKFYRKDLEIKHVHQLQNLYYALTQTELTDLEKFQNPRLKYASVNHYFKLFNKSQLDKIMSKPDNFNDELKREQIINRAIDFCINPLPNYLKFKN